MASSTSTGLTFFQPQPYNRGVTTVENTIHGTIYDINVIMSYAIDNLVDGIDFNIFPECEGVGKFDDIKLITSNQPIIKFIQIKHSKDINGTYEINDFAAGSDGGKKVALYLYFDSWYETVTDPRNAGKKFGFILYSNHTLSTEKFFHECIDGSTGKFVNHIIWSNPCIHRDRKYITTPPKNDSSLQRINWHRDHLYNSILRNSCKLNELSQVDINEKIKWIRQFFLEFTFKLGMPGLESLVQRIKIKLCDHYKVNNNNNAIYYAMYAKIEDALRKGNTPSHTLSSIKNMLDGYKAQFLTLQKWFGLTEQRLRNIADDINDHVIARDHQITTLNEFMQAPSHNILIIHGEPGIGKSNLIKQLFSHNKPRDGAYIFLDPSEIKSEDIVALGLASFDVFIIDNAETILNHTEKRKIVQDILQYRHQRKIMLLIQEQALGRVKQVLQLTNSNSSDFLVPFLTDEEVKVLLPTDLPLDTLLNDSQYPPELKKLLTIPFYLNLMIRIHAAGNNFLISNMKRIDRDSIIKLCIEGTSTQRTEGTFKKQRKKLLRIMLSKLSNTSSFLYHPSEGEMASAFNELIHDKIITKNKNNHFCFSHAIYERWVLHYLFVEKAINDIYEENHTPLFLFDRLQAALPTHSRSWFFLLCKKPGLLDYSKRYYSNKSREDYWNHPTLYSTIDKTKHFSSLIAVLAIYYNRHDILKFLLDEYDLNLEPELKPEEKPLIGGYIDNYFDPQDILDRSGLDYVGFAIECNNEQAIQALFTAGANCVGPTQNNHTSYDIGYEGTSHKACEKYNDARDEVNDEIDKELSLSPFTSWGSKLFMKDYSAPYLIRAASNSTTNVISMLWNKSKSNTSETLPTSVSQETPLHVATLENNEAAVYKLIELGHPLDMKDYWDETVLHHAIYALNKSIFYFLCRQPQLNINMINKWGRSPLHLAILAHDQDMINKLIELGANTEVKDRKGRSPMQLLKEVNDKHGLNLTIKKNVIAPQRSVDFNYS